ncbi:MAG TPA: hypothetical protein PKM57_06685 [Kiritimatiellia bacterium]|nr:hypothetical protein [Kiritimatiellia bacterium]HPS06641.1 hypothetical protein [Kiritimatiellia bacterium]
MKRIVMAGAFLTAGWAAAADGVLNPYAGVVWDRVEYVHSFSHQHGHSPEVFWDMGYRHLPFSNYYPSEPVYPLPAAFIQKHPEAAGAPNAEQHSTTDSGVHFNAVGSVYTTGYGLTPRLKAGAAPIEQVFQGVHVFNPTNAPWLGVYRLDLEFAPRAGTDAVAAVTLTVDGAVETRAKDFATVGDGSVRERTFGSQSPKSILLKTLADNIRVRVGLDPATTRITKFRLMQGTNRPWRDAFRAALDGMLYPDAGGLTINHPGSNLGELLAQLDFDERVLGVEVWNHDGLFGCSPRQPEAMTYYAQWDNVLRTGRRCFGFFVKDHYLYGRGRNVLLIPDFAKLTPKEREREALRAYRQGRFFGLLGAMATGADGKVVAPYDRSDFRFTRIAVRQNADGSAAGLEVAVGDADRTKRPNTQIRFITDLGAARVENAGQAFFAFPRDADGKIRCRYVRAEAFSYPDTHGGGKPLTHEAFSALNVQQIARLNDRLGDLSRTLVDPEGQEPVGIVDMLFSQAIQIRPVGP